MQKDPLRIQTQKKNEKFKWPGWIRRRLGLTYTQKSVSPTYKPKSVSVIHTAQESDVQQMELSSTFCNNHYGDRIQESTDMLYVYIITEKHSCTLTSTKPQINYGKGMRLQKRKGNKRSICFIASCLHDMAPIPSLEPEEAWSLWLDWGGVMTSGNVP